MSRRPSAADAPPTPAIEPRANEPRGSEPQLPAQPTDRSLGGPPGAPPAIPSPDRTAARVSRAATRRILSLRWNRRPPGPEQSAPRAEPRAASRAAHIRAARARLSVTDVRRLWPEVLEEVKGKRRFTWILLSQNAQVADVRDGVLVLAMSGIGARDSFAKGRQRGRPAGGAHRSARGATSGSRRSSIPACPAPSPRRGRHHRRRRIRTPPPIDPARTQQLRQQIRPTRTATPKVADEPADDAEPSPTATTATSTTRPSRTPSCWPATSARRSSARRTRLLSQAA